MLVTIGKAIMELECKCVTFHANTNNSLPFPIMTWAPYALKRYKSKGDLIWTWQLTWNDTTARTQGCTSPFSLVFPSLRKVFPYASSLKLALTTRGYFQEYLRCDYNNVLLSVLIRFCALYKFKLLESVLLFHFWSVKINSYTRYNDDLNLGRVWIPGWLQIINIM